MINKPFIILLIVLLSFSCKNSENKSASNDGLPSSLSMNMYVSTTSGIRLREKPSLESKTVKVLSYGSMLIIREAQPNEIQIDGVNGFWVRCAWYDLEGWVFSGYLKQKPDFQVFKQHPIGDYLNGDLPFVLYEKPDINSRKLNNSVNNVKIESIKTDIQKINSLPVRWAEVVARTSSGKQKGWIYNSQLVTNEESIANAESADISLIKSIIGNSNFKICEINIIGDVRILTVNPDATYSSSCAGYGESTCLNIIVQNGKVIFTDHKSGSMGYFEKIKNDYAFFYIELGEGFACSAHYEKKTTIINIKSLALYKVESISNSECIKCVEKDGEETCLNEKYKDTNETKYFNANNQIIKKEKYQQKF